MPKYTFRDLESGNVEVRLAAARHYARNATPEDLQALENASWREGVPWVSRALDMAIRRAKSTSVRKEEEPVIVPDPKQDASVRSVKAAAIEEVTGTVLHEFSSLIATVILNASDEVEEYDSSRTKKSLDRLSSVLAGIRRLKRASQVPTYLEFSLNELVQEIREEIASELEGINLLVALNRPITVVADREALRMAISNGLKNAIESVKEFSHRDPPEIIVNAGRAGAEFFLAINDSGVGFRIKTTDATKIGVTKKNDHIGFGLSIVRSAMEAMEGELNLSNSIEGGAIFELRWYKDNEDTVG